MYWVNYSHTHTLIPRTHQIIHRQTSITCSYNDTVYQADTVPIYFQSFDAFLRPLLRITAKIAELEKILGELIAHIPEYSNIS